MPTEKSTTTQARLRRIALQRLESLQRAGVEQLPRRKITSSFVLESPVPLPETPPAASSASPPTIPSSPPEIVMPKPKAPVSLKSPVSPKSQKAEAALAKIQADVAGCRRCEHLACARANTVFGIGTAKPRLCFFGEAPGAEEDRTGEPFVGRAGQLLTDIIEKGMKLNRSDVYILNVLKCRPPENRAPTDVEIENCREYFERQFEVLKPEFICCLGATATRALLNSTQALGKMRGKWFDYRGAKVMVTYHPSYLLRNPPAKKDTWEDIQMLMREMGLPTEKK